LLYGSVEKRDRSFSHSSLRCIEYDDDEDDDDDGAEVGAKIGICCVVCEPDVVKVGPHAKKSPTLLGIPRLAKI
jgi:hypothetical protein